MQIVPLSGQWWRKLDSRTAINCVTIFGLAAEPAVQLSGPPWSPQGTSSASQINIPAGGGVVSPTTPENVLGQARRVLPPVTSLAEFLPEIVAWLSLNFALPKTETLPKVEFVTIAQLTALHRNNALQQGEVDHQIVLNSQSEIAAVYSDTHQTIFLPTEWRATTAANLSVLVHEMVHHLQNQAQLKFACPQDREKLAFAAQNLWLEELGLNLASEFDLDGFTLLVRTNCGP